MEIGAARIDITPDLSDPVASQEVHLSGFVRRSGAARGVLHPIAARAMVAQCRGRRIAVVSLEVLELTPPHATALRRRIGKMLDIDAANVCLCCTHTHYAPAVFPLIECGMPSPGYSRMLDERIVRSVEQAAARLRPVRLVYGGETLNIGRNRRASLRGDRGGSNGVSPCDDEVRVLAAIDDTERVRAMLFHYACHPVSMPAEDNLISGDFAGVAASMLERRIGNEGAALFLNGCAGDINPRDEFKGAADRTETAGRLMAEAVTRALADARPIRSDDGIDAQAMEIGLATAGVDPAWRQQLDAVNAALAAPGLDPMTPDTRILRARRVFLTHRLAEATARYPAAVPSRLQRLRIGELTLLALSDEVFYEIGQAAAATGGLVWPVGYANGGGGYICTAAAYQEGGYEPNESNWFYDRPPLSAASAGELVATARSMTLTR